MIAYADTRLQQAREQLSRASAHLKECGILYGEERLDHGLPTDRGWALIPMCQMLVAAMELIEDLEQRVEKLEGTTAWPTPSH